MNGVALGPLFRVIAIIELGIFKLRFSLKLGLIFAVYEKLAVFCWLEEIDGSAQVDVDFCCMGIPVGVQHALIFARKWLRLWIPTRLGAPREW